jgi:hypothetical protein
VIPTHPFQETPRRHTTIRYAWIVVGLVTTCLALFTPRAAHAQASAGITGTVTDPSGAVVPNAKVTVVNEDTSVASTTVTGSAGTYAFRGLNPGKYRVTVEAQGFKQTIHQGVNVEVSTTATIDVQIATGTAAETVQVTAEQIALNTTAPELGSTIEPVVVAALPVEVAGRGRQIDQLQFTAPGTTGDTFSHRVSGGVDFEQEIVYNGIPAPQPETEGYTTNFNPPFELVQEYRVEKSTFSAQFGLGQGALTYQMASGTNTYHGDLFEINRNSLFDSVGFFNGPPWNSANTRRVPPTDHENNYGFTIGGPIRIPHLYDGRNKTFGHYSQEWYKRNNEDTDPGTVPTVQEKTNFDFSDQPSPIYDTVPGSPTFGQQFPGNRIPANRISPLAQSLLQYIPDPDRPGLLSNKSFAPYVNPQIQHVWGFVLDQTLTPTQSLHYSQWRNSYTTHSFDYHPIVLAPNPLNSQKFEPSLGSVFLLNYNNAISSHLVMTAGFGWIGEINNQFNMTKGATFGAVVNEDIPPNITFGPDSDQCNNSITYTCWGTGGSWLQSINRKLGIALVNNWLWTKGKNTFNMGIEFRRAYQDDNEEQTEGGHFNFSKSQTSIPDTSNPNFQNWGNPFASFLLGLPDSANRSNSQELQLRNFDLSPYLQDDIKLNPRLTVNLGLRWDIQAPFTENRNNVVFFNQDNPGSFPDNGRPGAASKLGHCTGCAGFGRADIHYGHFGPRLGFAYQLSKKMVVQGGINIAFLNGGAYEYGTNKVAVNYGNLLTGSFSRPSTGSYTSSLGSWDTNPIPAVNPTPFNPRLGAGNQINSLSKKNSGFAPYSEQWNVNLQRELPYNMFMTAAWVGNRIIHLPSKLNRINQLDPQYLALGGALSDTFGPTDTVVDGVPVPYPNFVSDFGGSATVAQALVPYPQYAEIMNNFEGSGTAYYQAAQIEVEKRWSNGLSFLAGYTLSHLMDNTSSGFSSFTAGGINKFNQRPEWAVSSADEPQTLKASGTYELPIGPGKKYVNNRTTGNIVGGWQVGWILDYEAGTPNGPSENGTPFPHGFNRPDRNPSVGLSTASYSRTHDAAIKGGPDAFANNAMPVMYTANAFTPTPSQYILGNAKRNYGGMRNPPRYLENLNARKNFSFTERWKAILSVDFFNAFNRTQFQGPDNNISDDTFGQVTQQSSQISNRQGQVSFRIEF